MAAYSEVKAGLDAIASSISEQRAVMSKVKSNAAIASAELAALATTYADVVATINTYGTTNAAEAAAKAELAKMVSEFTALKAKADQAAALDLNS